MKLIYKAIKISVILSFIVDIGWFIMINPKYLFGINLLFSFLCIVVLSKYTGRKQVEYLRKIFIIKIFIEPFIVYVRYSSIGLGLIAILIGCLLIFILSNIEYEIDYF